MLRTSRIVKLFTKISDQRERANVNRAAARIGWRPCRPMRYVLIAAAILILPTAIPASAEAAGPTQGFQIVNNNYVSNNNNYYPGSVRGGYYSGGSPYYQQGYRRSGMENHDAAVRRIKATHSRFRQTYHPRSYYNSPPHYYDYRGW